MPKIERWITENPITVEANVSVQNTVEIMAEKNIGAILITDEGNLRGIFSERDLLRIVARRGAKAFDDPIGDHMTKDPVVAQYDENANSVYMKMKTNNIRHVPILQEKNLIGIVSVRDLTRYYQNVLETEHSEAKERIEELERLTAITEDERIKTLVGEIKKYKDLSLTDPLTGLYNKRYFMNRLNEECSRAKRYKSDLSLIFCDVDFFKQINDEFGHHVGDRVLKQIAQILTGEMDNMNILSRLRKADIVARYGGEEFVAILPETPLDGAVFAAEKVRQVLADFQFRLNGDHTKITVSFGVAYFDDGVLDGDDLIKKADEALYRAKNSGRNRVEAYGDYDG